MAAEAIVSAGDLQRVAKAWNDQATNKGATSKYVESILTNGQTGEITITFKASMIGVAPAKNTLIISPFVRVNGNVIKPLKNTLAAGESGVVDWACSSQTQQTASLNGMTGATLGTMQPKFVPSICR